KLVFPFSKYCVTGTPSVVAPELARAWREETVLDFRRSDVFSVGVCMYRMLRPDSGDIDNGTGLEGKGPSERIEGRFGQQAWPLPLFPENKGGCPYEVSQLCRGLLQADPALRQDASEGLSLASWFVSRLEGADKRGVEGVPAPTGNGAGSGSMGPTTPGCGTTEGKSGAGGSCGRGSVGGAYERLASMSNPERESVVAIPVDGHHNARVGGGGSPPARSTSANQECRGDRTPPPEGAGDRSRRERDAAGRAASDAGAAAAGRSVSDEARRLGEPDELVRSDRISHMRDFFASAAPEDLFEALDTKAWDVAAACADFDDSASGKGRGENGKPVEVASTPASRVTLWFDGVAEELKG
ncbi:unnamed protein product, partial [Hapterophycus canaliculatus]